MISLNKSWEDAWDVLLVECHFVADNTLHVLKKFWGASVASLVVGWAIVGYAQFCLMLNSAHLNRMADNGGMPVAWHRAVLLVTTASGVIMPLYICKELAKLSSMCQEIPYALNLLRFGNLDRDRQVTALTNSLRSLNRGKGLGFFISSHRIDNSLLMTVAQQAGGSLAAGIPIFLAWGATFGTTEHDVDQQKDVWVAMCGVSQHEAECVWNSTRF